ncbi:hypothetical protein [Sphingosinicella humi]|uniref:Uncharacterized protein n=1 Tax=Allosphingosinicella humi TaxID=2068657 RepID=A0A2U2J2P7_9SPHN|nr:hypothetical protein [Sphingosinicella humi]PWG02620.1 hypothetical protein DF286_06885 [Sphingosinicella humi]
MAFKRKVVLAGLASLALAGAAAAAPGANPVNVLNVALPDGSVHIHYRGETPPRLVIAEAPAPVRFVPVSAYRAEMAPFATFRRIAAEMNQRMAAMMRLMAAAPAMPLDGAPGLRLASDGGVPGGGYSFVSRSVTQGGCTRTVQMVRAAGEAEPHVATRMSGDCGEAADVAPAPSVSRTTI